MTKEEYLEALNTPEWRAKRKVILKRDNHSCQACSSTEHLHIHHIWYIHGNMPWEVPDDYLITLCEICHAKEHKDRKISSFVKYDNYNKVSNKKKKRKKIINSIEQGKKQKQRNDVNKICNVIMNCLSKEEKILVKQKKLKFNIALLDIRGFEFLRKRILDKHKNPKVRNLFLK